MLVLFCQGGAALAPWSDAGETFSPAVSVGGVHTVVHVSYNKTDQHN